MAFRDCTCLLDPYYTRTTRLVDLVQTPFHKNFLQLLSLRFEMRNGLPGEWHVLFRKPPFSVIRLLKRHGLRPQYYD